MRETAEPGLDTEEFLLPEITSEELPETIGRLVINRLTHVIDLTERPSEWLPANALADRIGANTDWIRRHVREFGIDSEMTEYQGRKIACYPPFTLALLKDEFEWRKEFASLPPLITVSEMAERIGRSRGWTADALSELRVRPAKREWRPGRKVGLYYKGALKQVRARSLSYPLEDGWYNMTRLVAHFGEDRQWLQRRLAEAGIGPEVRRSALTGKLHEHYPPESIALLQGAKLERPGRPPEGWLTAEAMPVEVGGSHNWIKLRLSRHEDWAEPYRDEQGSTRLHYPPSVIEFLKKEREDIEAVPPAGDHLTLSAIVNLLGKSELWVSNRLKMIELPTERRRDGKGRVRKHYPPDTVQLLLKLPPDLRTR